MSSPHDPTLPPHAKENTPETTTPTSEGQKEPSRQTKKPPKNPAAKQRLEEGQLERTVQACEARLFGTQALTRRGGVRLDGNLC